MKDDGEGYGMNARGGLNEHWDGVKGLRTWL